MPINLQVQGPNFRGGELGLFAAHHIFMMLTLIGLVLLIIWMTQALKGRQLLTWLGIFLVVGVLGSFLTYRNEMVLATLNGTFPVTGQTAVPVGSFNGGLPNNASLAPQFKHASIAPMVQTLAKIDAGCRTAQCDKDVEKMMTDMMAQTASVMQKNAIK